ncbi:MAG: hypothetical protein IT238_06330 [Bacteroidia bacterium]|nr:hypothetical protein [Bacteroidia bacterium]MCZ2249850.1 hypothetical protein [Bacteroidia bacterium]
MKKLITTIILIGIFFISPLTVKPQSFTLFRSTNNYTFQYNLNKLQGSPEITNQILNKISQATGKPTYLVNYAISFNQTLELLNSNNFLTIQVSNNILSATGDINYRNFYIGDLLFPSALNIMLNITDERGMILRTLQISNINRANNYNTFFNTGLIPLGNQKLSVQLVNMIAYYDGQTINDFNYRTSLIDDYYGSSMILDNAQSRLSSIVFISPDNVEATTIALQQVENDINIIEAKNYINLLQLSQQDPINLAGRIASLRNILAQKRMSVNMAYSALDSYYYNKGMEAYMNKDNALALTWCGKSLAVNPLFAPAGYLMSQVMFDNNQVLDADLKLREVWFKMSPDPSIYNKSLILFKNIYNEYLDNADKKYQSGHYNESIQEYERAQKLCNEIRGLICTENLNIGLGKNRQKIYDGLMADAIKLAESGNNNEAYIKFNQAKNYAKDNKSYIQDKSMEEKADKSLKLNDYKTAINDAKEYYKNKNYNAALASFESAHDLENKYNYSPSLIPLDIEQKNAREVIMIKVNDINELASKNKWDDTKTIMAKVEEMQSFYKLQNDSEINNSLAKVKSQLKEATCVDIQKKLNSYYETAKDAKGGNNYIIADENYEKYINTANENPDCNINTTMMAEEKMQILPAATYQRLINKIIDLQMNGQYKEAVGKYKEAMAYYSQYEISKFNIHKKSLKEFALNNFKNAALEYVANTMRNDGQIDDAFELYKALINRNYPEGYINTALLDLGKSFGARDKAANVTDFKSKVTEYTGGNKKLKFFQKGYYSAFGK